MPPLRKLFAFAVTVIAALIVVGGATAHHLPKATISCTPQYDLGGAETGASCTVTNNTKFSMLGTISSPDAGTAILPLTIQSYSFANIGLGFSFVPGATYHFTWTAPHGVNVSTAVTL